LSPPGFFALRAEGLCYSLKSLLLSQLGSFWNFAPDQRKAAALATGQLAKCDH
jgi:hypothetical protein